MTKIVELKLLHVVLILNLISTSLLLTVVTYLSEQNSSLISFPKFAARRPQLGLESCRLLGLPLPLVEHLGQRLQGGQCQLQSHPVVVARWRLLQIYIAFFCQWSLHGIYLEEVLQQEDELGKPLDGFHHQPKEVEPVGGSDLLHLQKVGKS